MAADYSPALDHSWVLTIATISRRHHHECFLPLTAAFNHHRIPTKLHHYNSLSLSLYLSWKPYNINNTITSHHCTWICTTTTAAGFLKLPDSLPSPLDILIPNPLQMLHRLYSIWHHGDPLLLNNTNTSFLSVNIHLRHHQSPTKNHHMSSVAGISDASICHRPPNFAPCSGSSFLMR